MYWNDSLSFRCIIDFLIDEIEMFRSLSTSASTGVAPVNKTELAVATNVMSGTITSDPFPIPSAFSDRCNAAVPLDTPTANFTLVNFAKMIRICVDLVHL